MSVVVPQGKFATIQDRFETFHQLNPWVLESLIQIAREYRSAGRERIGVKALVEILRWHMSQKTRGDHFKLNNSYTSRYARLIVEKAPDLDGMIELRELRAQ